jgi:hypothetical protein
MTAVAEGYIDRRRIDNDQMTVRAFELIVQALTEIPRHKKLLWPVTDLGHERM